MRPGLPLKRPLAVTITYYGVFLLGLWNSGRALVLYRQIDLLLGFDLNPDPRVRLAAAVIWAVLFWVLTIALRQKRPMSRLAVPALLILYTTCEITLLLFLAPAPLARGTWGLNVIIYLGMILFSFWSLNRRAAKSYFAEP